MIGYYEGDFAHKVDLIARIRRFFSAVSLINGESGEQFNQKFVEAFNETIRNRYIKR